jgi:hypothetical protein
VTFDECVQSRGGLATALLAEAERDVIAEMAAMVRYSRAQELIASGALALAQAKRRLADMRDAEAPQQAAVDSVSQSLRETKAQIAMMPETHTAEGVRAYRQAEETRQAIEHDWRDAKALLATRHNATDDAQTHVQAVQETLARLLAIEAPAVQLWPMVLADSSNR